MMQSGTARPRHWRVSSGACGVRPACDLRLLVLLRKIPASFFFPHLPALLPGYYFAFQTAMSYPERTWHRWGSCSSHAFPIWNATLCSNLHYCFSVLCSTILRDLILSGWRRAWPSFPAFPLARLTLSCFQGKCKASLAYQFSLPFVPAITTASTLLIASAPLFLSRSTGMTQETITSASFCV